MLPGSITYSEDVANEILQRIGSGETLRSICRDKHMPSFVTVYTWMTEHADFSLRFARAREVGFDAIADEALEIADTRDPDPNTGEDDTAHRKLRIETRLKLLAKWSTRYSDKTSTEITGRNGGPIEITSELDEVERAKRVAFILERGLAMQRNKTLNLKAESKDDDNG